MIEDENERLISAITPHLQQLGVGYIINPNLFGPAAPLMIKDFGSQNGIAIAPLLNPPPQQTKFYTKMGEHILPISRLDLNFIESCSGYDIIEMLSDWGYFGPLERRPNFIENN